MKKLLLFCCVVNGLAMSVYAEQLPIISTLDSRIQVFNYTTEDVFAIKTKLGHSSLIQFEDGEIIHDDGGLGVGEARDWSIAVKGNNVFFKPLKAIIEPTNMIIVTNKRTYVFSLQTTQFNDMTYVVRFKYPEQKLNQVPPHKMIPPTLQRVRQGNETYFIDAKINTAYLKRGNMEIAPTAMWDDGLFTYLQYDNAKELPSVYKVMPDGSESLVNTHIEDDRMVIHETNHLYRIRLGGAVAELANQRVVNDSSFNRTGTSQPDIWRIEQQGKDNGFW